MNNQDITIYQGESAVCTHCDEEIVKGEGIYAGDTFPELLHERCYKILIAL